jgi:hypothetical protein
VCDTTFHLPLSPARKARASSLVDHTEAEHGTARHSSCSTLHLQWTVIAEYQLCQTTGIWWCCIASGAGDQIISKNLPGAPLRSSEHCKPSNKTLITTLKYYSTGPSRNASLCVEPVAAVADPPHRRALPHCDPAQPSQQLML